MDTFTSEQLNLLTSIQELAFEAGKSGVDLVQCMAMVQVGYNQGIQSLSRARTPRGTSRGGRRSNTPNRARRGVGSEPSADVSRGTSRGGRRSNTPSRARRGVGSEPSADVSRGTSRGGRSGSNSRARRGVGSEPSADVPKKPTLEEKLTLFFERLMKRLIPIRGTITREQARAILLKGTEGKTNWDYVKKDAKLVKDRHIELPVSPEVQAAIKSVTDEMTLDGWLEELVSLGLVEFAIEKVETEVTGQLTGLSAEAEPQVLARVLPQECEGAEQY